ncbi:hypothetical protein R3P38DRAFT_3238586 [Favolaschia claudopus]|uniref:Uncharacterized protein n=1 Tax=Favolaschia claudopus TaxID=2862362 RepID=A0AAV9ZAN5_9AGAR
MRQALVLTISLVTYPRKHVSHSSRLHHPLYIVESSGRIGGIEMEYPLALRIQGGSGLRIEVSLSSPPSRWPASPAYIARLRPRFIPSTTDGRGQLARPSVVEERHPQLPPAPPPSPTAFGSRHKGVLAPISPLIHSDRPSSPPFASTCTIPWVLTPAPPHTSAPYPMLPSLCTQCHVTERSLHFAEYIKLVSLKTHGRRKLRGE